jgi:hypothetical protein
MTDIQGFTTKAAAVAEIAKMRGWDARPVHLFLPGHELADAGGNVWAVACYVGNSDPVYLRADGGVR